MTSERTVSVELTETEIRWIQSYIATKVGYGFPQRMNIALLDALCQFGTDRERDAKECALSDAIRSHLRDGAIVTDYGKGLQRLNDAGWDLVRIGESD